MLRSSIAPCGVRTIIPSAAFCQVWTLDRKLKAAATADEGTRAVARRRFLPCVSPLTRRSLLICSSFSHNRGFQLALPSLTFLNAAIHTNSAVSAPARRAVFGFAEYGRRRLSPPLSRCPLRGQRGAAPLSPFHLRKNKRACHATSPFGLFKRLLTFFFW